MDLLLVAPEFRARFLELGYTSSAAVSRLVEQPSGKFRAVVVRPLSLRWADGSEEHVYFKRYNYLRPSWRFFGRASKARREFLNYQVFRRLGIRSPDTLATGESRDGLGRLKSAWILTRAVPDALTLTEFVQKHCPDPTSSRHRALRDSLIEDLAAMTRGLHQANFVHNDLVWRNVLVTWNPPAPPLIWWIDCPRGHVARIHRRRQQVKDLALLDKLAAHHCTPAERLRFVRLYLGRTKLDSEVKRWARDVSSYSDERW